MDKKIMGRRKWRNAIRREHSNVTGNSNNSFSSIRAIKRTIKDISITKLGQYKEDIQGVLKSTSGLASTVGFLIWFSIITFLLFGGVDYFITEIQFNNIEEINNFYMSKAQMEGNLGYNDRQLMFEELTRQGLIDIEIDLKDAYGNILGTDDIIVRDIESPRDSQMTLSIMARPEIEPFIFGRLLGVEVDEKFFFHVEGRVLSERPDF